MWQKARSYIGLQFRRSCLSNQWSSCLVNSQSNIDCAWCFARTCTWTAVGLNDMWNAVPYDYIFVSWWLILFIHGKLEPEVMERATQCLFDIKAKLESIEKTCYTQFYLPPKERTLSHCTRQIWNAFIAVILIAFDVYRSKICLSNYITKYWLSALELPRLNSIQLLNTTRHYLYLYSTSCNLLQWCIHYPNILPHIFHTDYFARNSVSNQCIIQDKYYYHNHPVEMLERRSREVMCMVEGLLFTYPTTGLGSLVTLVLVGCVEISLSSTGDYGERHDR